MCRLLSLTKGHYLLPEHDCYQKLLLKSSNIGSSTNLPQSLESLFEPAYHLGSCFYLFDIFSSYWSKSLWIESCWSSCCDTCCMVVCQTVPRQNSTSIVLNEKFRAISKHDLWTIHDKNEGNLIYVCIYVYINHLLHRNSITNISSGIFQRHNFVISNKIMIPQLLWYVFLHHCAIWTIPSKVFKLW